MGKLGLIIKREYWTRVRKKTFIIMSFLGPLLIVGFLALTAYLSKGGKNNYKIIVFDEAKIYQKYIGNSNPGAYELNYYTGEKKIEEAKLALSQIPLQGLITMTCFYIFLKTSLIQMA